MLVEIETVDESIQSHLGGQLRYLSNNGFEVAFIASDTGLLRKICDKEGVTGYSVHMNRDPSPVADLVSLWRLTRLLRHLRPDIVNYGTPKAGLLGAIASWLARVPVRVYTRHGLRHETLVGPLASAFLVIERVIGRLSTNAVMVSESVRTRSAELGVLPRNATVLGPGSANGVDVGRFSELAHDATVRSTFLERLHIPDSAFVIAFLGRITPDKGINELVTAFASLQERHPEVDWRLLLAGSREDWDSLTDFTRDQICENPRIYELGHTDPGPVLAAATVVCLPSYREGLGTVLLEASAAERLIIGARSTGIVDVIQHDQTGLLVEPGDAAELSEAIYRTTDGALRDRLVRNARLRVATDFSQEAVWERWRAYFAALA